jgi:hypothetical protein
MWLVRGIDGSAYDIPIAIGQFSIDEECLAPVNSFSKCHGKMIRRCLIFTWVKRSGILGLR